MRLFPIHDVLINYQWVVLNINDKIVCFYDSVDGGESDANESEYKTNSYVVTKSEAYNLVGFTIKVFW